jgi:hypothetical protein
LQKCVASRVAEADAPICVNTFYAPSAKQQLLSAESSGADVVVEHSLLSGRTHLSRNAILSHASAFLGRDLRVREGIMMQQVYLKSTNTSNGTANSALQCVVQVLGIADDVKRTYYDGWNTFCCAPWSNWLVRHPTYF